MSGYATWLTSDEPGDVVVWALVETPIPDAQGGTHFMACGKTLNTGTKVSVHGAQSRAEGWGSYLIMQGGPAGAAPQFDRLRAGWWRNAAQGFRFCTEFWVL